MNNQIIVLETSGIQAELQANDNAIAALKDKYGVVPTEYKMLSTAYSEVRQVRLAIGKRWESKKKEIASYRKSLDGEAERLTNLVLEIENPLKDAKHAIDSAKKAEEEARVKAEAERIDNLLYAIKLITDMPYRTADKVDDLKDAIESVKACVSDFDFQEYTDKARESYKIAIKNLQDRLSVRESLEKEQAALAEERRKLAEEKAAMEAQKAALQSEPAITVPENIVVDGIKDYTQAEATCPAVQKTPPANSTQTLVEKLRTGVKVINALEAVTVCDPQEPLKKGSTFEITFNENTDCLEIFHNNIMIDDFPCVKAAFDFTREKILAAYKVGFWDGQRK